jgi:hypothetical protein
MNKEDPVISKSYRDDFITNIKKRSLVINANVEILIKIVEGKLLDKPYVGFYRINRKLMETEINRINKSISIQKKSLEEKQHIKLFKSYLRSLKRI